MIVWSLEGGAENATASRNIERALPIFITISMRRIIQEHILLRVIALKVVLVALWSVCEAQMVELLR